MIERLHDAAYMALLALGEVPTVDAGEGMPVTPEPKQENIRVTSAVLPSVVDTPANRASMADADFASWVAPMDLAEVMIFLATERARAVTGAAIPVYNRA